MMMMPSTLLFLHLCLVLFVTRTIASPTSLIGDRSQFDDDEQNPTAVIDADQLPTQENLYQSLWPHLLAKRYATKVIRGDSRVWAIPYRFGKRAAMPYRFGKRAQLLSHSYQSL